MKPEKYTTRTSMQWFGDDLITYSHYYSEFSNHKKVAEYLFDNNIFNSTNAATAKDRINNVSIRAKKLGEIGLKLLLEGEPTDQAILTLSSYLNLYRLTYEYVFEELITKIHDYGAVVNVNEFENFYYNKQSLYAEELKLSVATLRKIRTQMYNVLHRSGLLEKEGLGRYRLLKIKTSDKIKEFFKNTPYLELMR